MVDFRTNQAELTSHCLEEINLFQTSGYLPQDLSISLTSGQGGDHSFSEIAIGGRIYKERSRMRLEGRDYIKFQKLSMYRALRAYTGIEMPWGSLTGIRPTKILYDDMLRGKSRVEAVRNLQDIYLVSQKKANLAGEIIRNQQGFITRDPSRINLYIHIPFCHTKCKYCSFITATIDQQAKWVEPYVERLIEEIEDAKRMIRSDSLTVDSVYIGGGTPTAITDRQLERILSAISFSGEFTCEAGRPDSVSGNKLEIMKQYGVTRVCINPQSLMDRTLEKIGRAHTAADFFKAFSLARSFRFAINIDLIAGLEAETLSDFRTSIDFTAALHPDNITVHTLSRKRGAVLKQEAAQDNPNVAAMLEYAAAVCEKRGYLPYYLYRQKYMMGNLENVGYALPGKQCRNNITTMEECLTVLACGAGAISKRIVPGGRIERYANVKDVKLYVEEWQNRLDKKHIFFQNGLQ